MNLSHRFPYAMTELKIVGLPESENYRTSSRAQDNFATFRFAHEKDRAAFQKLATKRIAKIMEEQ